MSVLAIIGGTIRSQFGLQILTLTRDQVTYLLYDLALALLAVPYVILCVMVFFPLPPVVRRREPKRILAVASLALLGVALAMRAYMGNSIVVIPLAGAAGAMMFRAAGFRLEPDDKSRQRSAIDDSE